MRDGGKGRPQRLPEVPEEQVAKNWNTIFGPSRFDRWKEEQQKKEEEKKDGLDIRSGDVS